MLKSLQYHPFADVFPLMQGEEFEELVEDIRENGLHESVVLHEDKILDGRNRYRALQAICERKQMRGRGWGVYEGTTIEPVDLKLLPDVPWFRRYSVVESGDPRDFVISKNIHRRHLNESQRSMIAAKLACMGVGRPPEDANSANLRNFSQLEAAERMHISERSVRTAKQVVDKGSPSLVEAVEKGKASVSAAAEIVDLPTDEQDVIARLSEKEIIAHAKQIKARKQVEKKERRQAREAELTGKQLVLPKKQYGVIYADLEREFEPWSAETGMDRTPENRETTTPVEEIMALQLRDIAAPDSVLFLWVASPRLADGLRVMHAWGFTYVTDFVWTKDKIGPGCWNHNKHEHLLVGKRGHPPTPATSDQWDSVIDASCGRHGEKPAAVYELIESYFPNLPKIELSARAARPGWECWSNDAPAMTDDGAIVHREIGDASPGPSPENATPSPRRGDAQPEGGIMEGPDTPLPQTGEVGAAESHAGILVDGTAERSTCTIEVAGERPLDAAAEIERTNERSAGDLPGSIGIVQSAVGPERAPSGADDPSPPDILDELRRIELTTHELEMVRHLRLEDCDSDEQDFINMLRKHPESATVATRTLLYKLAKQQGLIGEQVL